jgi:hypothetical protein
MICHAATPFILLILTAARRPEFQLPQIMTVNYTWLKCSNRMAGLKLQTAATLQSVKVPMKLISLLYSNVNHLKPGGRYMYRTVVTICTVQWSLCTAQWSLYVPHSGHHMYRTVVTICTASLTLINSTFCPHSVFMCLVWISEQTAIISLYNINWLVCITEMEGVYCAVRTGSLCTIQVHLGLIPHTR